MADGDKKKKPKGRAGGRAGAAIGRAVGGAVGGAVGAAVGAAPQAALEKAAPALKDFAQEVLATAAGLGQLNQAALSYVGTFSPSLMGQMSLAFRDLSAVIGSALSPVLEGMTSVVKDFASAMLPLADKIAPVLGEVMGAIVPIAEALTDVIVSLVEALMPLMPVVVALTRMVLDCVRAFQIIAEALFKTIGGALANAGDGIQSFADKMRAGFQEFLKLMVQFVAMLAKLFGADQFVADMADGAERAAKGGKGKRQDATGFAPAQNARFSSLDQIGKDIAVAASMATAGGAGVQKTSEVWLSQLAADLAQIRDEGKSLKEMITDAILAAWQKTKEGAKKAINQGGEGFMFAGGKILDVFSVMGGAADPNILRR